MICYNLVPNAVLRLLDPIFKMDTGFKTSQIWRSNVKKNGIRTSSAQFEVCEICIIMRDAEKMSLFNVSYLTLVALKQSYGESRKNLFGNDVTQT